MRIKFLFFLILCMVLLILSSCMDELEYTPRPASFSDFYPTDGTSGIEPYISLYWSCDFAYYYQLYIGTQADSLELIEDNFTLTEYIIDQLYLGTTYYWQVIAYNGGDVPEAGPVLSFSTRNGLWGSFFPFNGAGQQSLDLTFSWGLNKSLPDEVPDSDIITGAENDNREEDPTIIYYDFYLGFDPDTLEAVVQNSLDEYISVHDLLYNTEYYWQVKARNIISELAPSEIMHFGTMSPDWQQISPSNGASDQEIALTLNWAIDANRSNFKNGGDEKKNSSNTRRVGEFTYDLYLGTGIDELEQIASGLEDPGYEVAGLDYRVEYYWQVKAIYNDTQELMSEIYDFNTKDRFYNLHPEDYELYIEINPTLSWSCIDGEAYDLYAGSDISGLNLIVSGLRDTSYTLHNLDYETIYQWRVDAELTDGTTWLGTESSFITMVDPVPPGYKLHNHLLRAEMPCNIDVVYRVTDRADNVTTEFEEADFLFLEDGEEIDAVESALNIYSGSDINSSIRTVLMIDNSTSMESLLEEIKLAAYGFVEDMEPDQQMCVYAFSEQVELMEDFTSNQANLIGAINSIQTGYASTDLYGAIITGVDRWSDMYYPENINKGNLIVVTDGSDTQGSSTLQEALEARGNKLVYTMGIGHEIDQAALSALGNGGFFELETVAEANSVFDIIQQEITDYLSSFYWLHYITPKRGNVDHTIAISILNNPNTGSDSIINGIFNSSGFYGTLPGVYVNIDPENNLPYGIEEYTIIDSAGHKLEATTYNAAEEPEYVWEIDNPAIAEIFLVNQNGQSIVIRAGGTAGTTELTVRDIVNDHSRIIDIISGVEFRKSR